MATSQLTQSVVEAIKERRTYYQLNKEAPISDSKIKELVEQTILHVPSSFNSQSTRMVVLLNNDHEQFWDFVVEVLKPLTPEDKFDGSKQKINGFKSAYGTVSTIPPHCFEGEFADSMGAVGCMMWESSKPHYGRALKNAPPMHMRTDAMPHHPNPSRRHHHHHHHQMLSSATY